MPYAASKTLHPHPAGSKPRHPLGGCVTNWRSTQQKGSAHSGTAFFVALSAQGRKIIVAVKPLNLTRQHHAQLYA
ncbi:RNA polymerase beta subunit [Acetobacter orientalis]|uniref:RNA polymerase beta subunit, partial n=1 Tax=Acetobacter orientalis TaxID=146474 RepID=A0A2Z5ZCP5_9PROT|nr:RNA polymerase beta subunit [Acetobacter orientalis]